MTRVYFLSAAVAAFASFGVSAEEPSTTSTDGRTTGEVRTESGELIRFDAATRLGAYRREGTDEIIPFRTSTEAVLRRYGPGPAEYRPAERLRFQIRSGGDANPPVVVDRIEDEASLAVDRGHVLHVEMIDERRWPRLQCVEADREKRETFDAGVYLEISPETRIWKAGRPVVLADLRVGDRMLARTGGVGFGKIRIAWDLYLVAEGAPADRGNSPTIRAIP